MGQSFATVGGAAKEPPTTAAAGLPFESKGVQYSIDRSGERVIHKAKRRGADGKVFAETEAEVRFRLGSGTRGITYLIERDGFLLQSPIAWFAQEGRWEISPGYGEFTTNANFERPIQPECLFCHSNQFRPVAGTLNRYEQPIFEGHAIGCERCHGPGALHAKAGGSSAESDFTIVNPANLAAPLRDSVCQQCHLQGSFRFLRAGREILDFRPGLALHQFWAIFLTKKDEHGRFEAVGHDEQMQSSRCFRESRGELGCISCHDPHRVPAPATRAAYYRERCMACHERRGCALPLAERQARGKGEDCVACHMPRPAVTNIPHTAATDHRIARTPGHVSETPPDASGQPKDIPVRDYHWGVMTEEERRDDVRDLGMALAWGARLMSGSPPAARMAATQSVPFLEAAVRDRPDDLSAGESLGIVLGILGRREQALRAFDNVLRIEPDREWTIRSSGRMLAQLQRFYLARAALQKTIAINLWKSEYRLALARICAQTGDWPAAIAACREAIRINPELVEARSLLIQCYLWSNEPDKAESELQILLRFYPASREVWQEWYAQQKQAGPPGGRSSTTGER